MFRELTKPRVGHCKAGSMLSFAYHCCIHYFYLKIYFSSFKASYGNGLVDLMTDIRIAGSVVLHVALDEVPSCESREEGELPSKDCAGNDGGQSPGVCARRIQAFALHTEQIQTGSLCG